MMGVEVPGLMTEPTPADDLKISFPGPEPGYGGGGSSLSLSSVSLDGIRSGPCLLPQTLYSIVPSIPNVNTSDKTLNILLAIFRFFA